MGTTSSRRIDEFLNSILLVFLRYSLYTFDDVLTFSSEDLITIASDPVGSRAVVEPIFDAGVELHQTKQKLIENMKGAWKTLSTDRFGTYSVQKAFKAATLQKKIDIVQELASSERLMSSNVFGRHVIQVCGVGLFARNRRQWEEQMRGTQKRKAAFKEITGGEAPRREKRRK